MRCIALFGVAWLALVPGVLTVSTEERKVDQSLNAYYDREVRKATPSGKAAFNSQFESRGAFIQAVRNARREFPGGIAWNKAENSPRAPKEEDIRRLHEARRLAETGRLHRQSSINLEDTQTISQQQLKAWLHANPARYGVPSDVEVGKVFNYHYGEQAMNRVQADHGNFRSKHITKALLEAYREAYPRFASTISYYLQMDRLRRH